MADDEAKVVAKGAWTIVCPPALLACAGDAAEGGGEYAATGGADAALRSCGKTMDDKSILNLALPPDPEAEAEALEDDEDMVRGGRRSEAGMALEGGGDTGPESQKKRGNAPGGRNESQTW